MEWLETVATDSADAAEPDFRFPVQYVSRPHADFRGFAGTIASGQVRVGDEVTVARSGVSSAIRYIVTADGELETA
ncbi:bifunctional sulfate adenylyltransferase subunit 1/adenylylsulfate kinase, partial [Ochrobactrum sp. SFR4]|nr:bifunctional sulfate adenylyltransferase subunit 1/adenylylsulfate kinase [Ochrobactrum sp. SFR4]